MMRCPECYVEDMRPCTECDCAGFIVIQDTPEIYEDIMCQACNGQGQIKHKCPRCGGARFVNDARWIITSPINQN